ncbi:MAG: hypothetical protein JNM98_21795 [Rhodocyclaceae bacterium]|nr:hypothetical protein [Rhodocyclaceae bacterium]
MDEAEVLAAIEDGESAYGLLSEKCPMIERRFNRVCKTIVDLLADVRKEFPDAQYYTASGGFNLMLGNPHADDRNQTPQQELIALRGNRVRIGDGDF